MTAVDFDLAALAPALSIIAPSLTIVVTVGGLVVRSRDRAYLEGQITAKATATAEAVAELQRRIGVDETALAALRVEIAQRIRPRRHAGEDRGAAVGRHARGVADDLEAR